MSVRISAQPYILRNSAPIAPDSKKNSASILRSVAGRVGDGVKWTAKGVAHTAFDAAKWTVKKCASKVLDVTGWVAKGAIIASIAATVLTAAGAAVSPSATVKIIDSIAQALGAQARMPGDVGTIGEAVIIQSKYTGELLALLIKNGVELGAKSAVYTVQAVHTHIVKPLFDGFTGIITQEAGKAWSAVRGFFSFTK